MCQSRRHRVSSVFPEENVTLIVQRYLVCHNKILKTSTLEPQVQSHRWNDPNEQKS